MLHFTAVSLSSDCMIVYDTGNNDNDQTQP